MYHSRSIAPRACSLDADYGGSRVGPHSCFTTWGTPCAHIGTGRRCTEVCVWRSWQPGLPFHVGYPGAVRASASVLAKRCAFVPAGSCLQLTRRLGAPGIARVVCRCM